jgi:hypothetical protein
LNKAIDRAEGLLRIIVFKEKNEPMDLVPLKKHSLTRAQFEQLADVPPEEEWLAGEHHKPENAPGLQGRCTGVYPSFREDI